MSFSNSWVAKAVTAKGQLHCHSTNSDGTKTPAQVVQAYLDDDYDFVCITDHDHLTTDPAVGGITFIQGDEANTASLHLGCVGITQLPSGTCNEAIAQVHADGGFTQLNHVDFSSYVIPLATLNTLVGYDAIEYVNGFVQHDSTCFPNNPDMPLPQIKCDRLWSLGNRFWITACDDCHDHADATCNEQNNAWVMVNAASTSAANIVSELKAGNFYISDGALIDSVTVSGNNITITLPASSTVTWQVQGCMIAQTDTSVTEATYTAKPNEDIYILIKVVNGAGKRAWAQPIFNDGPPIMLTKAGYFTLKTSTGSQATTGVGFRPRALILFYETSAGWTSSYCFSVGVSSDYGCAAIGGSDYSGQATTVCARGQTRTSQVINWAGTIYSNALVSTFDADGFTLNYTVASTGADRIYYFAIGGTAVQQTAVKEWWPAATGNQSVTGVGFQPDAVFHFGMYSNTSGAHNDVTSVYHFGAMDAAGNQWANYVFAQDAVATTNTARVQRTDKCIVGLGSQSTLLTAATFVSMDADGFTVNHSAQQGRMVYSLCLKGGSYKVGHWDKSTNTSVPVTETITTTGILPKGVLTTNVSNVAMTGNAADGLRLAFGASDGTNNYFNAIQSKDNAADSLSYSRYSATQSLEVCDNDAHTDDAGGTMGNFVAQAFDAVWATNNNVATEICYMVFGEAYATAAVTAAVAAATSAGNAPTVSGAAGVTAIPARAVSLAGMPTPVEDACQVKFCDWPELGTTVINKGIAGVSYNGTATDNDFEVLASGATCFHLDANTDITTIPTGIVNTNSPFTMECLFNLDVSGTPSVILLSINWNFYAIINPGWSYIIKYNPAFDGYKAWVWTTDSAPEGEWTYLQIAWDTSGFDNTPVVKINNTQLTLSASHSGSVTQWCADSGFYIGNGSQAHATLGKIALFKFHSRKLLDSELIQNVNAESWRVGSVLSGATISGAAGVDAVRAQATAAIPAPAPGAGIGITAVKAAANSEAPVPALETNNILAAVKAEATATAPAPTASGAAGVAAVNAAATATAPVPVASGAAGVDAVKAEAAATAPVPVLTSDNILSAVAATATADAHAPDVSSEAIIAAVVAAATAVANAPEVSIEVIVDALINAAVATATADAIAPSSISGDAGVDAVSAEAAAEAPAPELISNNIIFAAVAEAVAESEAPSVSGDALVAAAVAEAIAEAYAPEIFNEMSVMIAAAVAEAMADSIAPTIEGDVWADVLINALVAEAAADAIAPDASGDAGVDAVVADALADATAPVISGDALIEAIVAEALAEAISPEITEYQGIEIGAVVATATAVAIVPEIFGEIVNVPYCEPEVDFTGTEFLITVLGGVYSEIISMLAQEAGATAFVGSYIDKTDFSASVGAATTIDAIYEDYTHMEGILPAIKLVGFIRCKA
jgi:hypothetical protein